MGIYIPMFYRKILVVSKIVQRQRYSSRDRVTVQPVIYTTLTLTVNMSRFLFETDSNGNVRLVHCHPQDHEKLLFIKKAMVSLFSVHVKVYTAPFVLSELSSCADKEMGLGSHSLSHSSARP